jgi:RNA polymerase subunit RPABC4/transcription elongation factor Spt4
MKNKQPKAEFKICKRCNRHQAEDIICPSCKNELLSSYNNIDWETAFEAEKAHNKALRYRMDEDF